MAPNPLDAGEKYVTLNIGNEGIASIEKTVFGSEYRSDKAYSGLGKTNIGPKDSTTPYHIESLDMDFVPQNEDIGLYQLSATLSDNWVIESGDELTYAVTTVITPLLVGGPTTVTQVMYDADDGYMYYYAWSLSGYEEGITVQDFYAGTDLDFSSQYPYTHSATFELVESNPSAIGSSAIFREQVTNPTDYVITYLANSADKQNDIYTVHYFED